MLNLFANRMSMNEELRMASLCSDTNAVATFRQLQNLESEIPVMSENEISLRRYSSYR